MKTNIFIIVLILLTLTTLLAYDFFPDLLGFFYLPKSVLFALLIIIVIFSIFANRFQKDNSRIILLWQIISTLYLFSLIVIFTILGGISQVGISLKSPVLWIVISIYEIYKHNKKVNVSNSFS